MEIQLEAVAETRLEPEMLCAVRDLLEGRSTEASSRRLYQGFYPQLCGFFRNRGLTPPDAEDLAQETFLLAFERLATLREPGEFRPWLFGIASNVRRNDLRERSRRESRSAELASRFFQEDGPEDLWAHGGEPGPRPDAGLLLAERRRRLLAQMSRLPAALAKLPSRMRLCVALRLRGKKVDEIAAAVRLPPGTVKSNLARATGRLRKELENATLLAAAPAAPAAPATGEEPFGVDSELYAADPELFAADPRLFVTLARQLAGLDGEEHDADLEELAAALGSVLSHPDEDLDVVATVLPESYGVPPEARREDVKGLFEPFVDRTAPLVPKLRLLGPEGAVFAADLAAEALELLQGPDTVAAKAKLVCTRSILDRVEGTAAAAPAARLADLAVQLLDAGKLDEARAKAAAAAALLS